MLRVTVERVTSTTQGVLIRVTNGAVPSNCTGSPNGWMLLDKEQTAMISVFLTWYAQRARTFDIYTNPRTTGLCVINQLDPGS